MTQASDASARQQLADWLNLLGLLGICGTLAMALVWQLAYHELPCPLCQLQRVGFVLVGVGFMMNVRFGTHPTHYGMIILSALAGAAAAARQLLLHVAPGDAGYGSPFFGLHFYTWALVLFVLVLAGVALLLLLDSGRPGSGQPLPQARKLAPAVMLAFLALVAANLVSTLLECGLGACPDDPVNYLWLP